MTDTAKGRRKRGDFKFFDNFNWYVPGVGQMFILLLMLLVGAVLGNLVTLAFTLAGGQEAASDYAMLIAYPVMFIPAMMYAGARSKIASCSSAGVKLDSGHYGRTGGMICGLLVVAATLASGFCLDISTALLPEMPEQLE